MARRWNPMGRKKERKEKEREESRVEPEGGRNGGLI
jgi:hypothetical protein